MAITHDATAVYVSGTESGDNVRAYIAANSLGTVADRTAVMARDLVLQSTAVLTDSLASWIFPGQTQFRSVFVSVESNRPTINFTDVDIRISGTQRSDGFGFLSSLQTNWSRGTFKIENLGATARQDFFWTTGSELSNLDDVTLHTNAHLTYSFFRIPPGVTINSSAFSYRGGPDHVFPGVFFDIAAGATLNQTNFSLRSDSAAGIDFSVVVDGTGVMNMYSPTGGRAGGTWFFARRASGNPAGVTINFYDPNKPSGWAGYAEVMAAEQAFGTFNEFYTFAQTVQNQEGQPVASARLVLTNLATNTDVIAATVDEDGKLPPTYVLTRFMVNQSSTMVAHLEYDLLVYKYGFSKLVASKAFSNSPLIETAILFADTNVTLSLAAATALTTVETLDDLYDLSALWGTASDTQAKYPSYGAFPVTASGAVIDLGNLNLVIDGTASVPFAVDTASGTITISADTLTSGTKFARLVTTGVVSTVNGGEITVPYIDATGVSVAIRIEGGGAFAARLLINGAIQDAVFGVTSLPLTVQPTDTIRIAISSFGRRARIIDTTGEGLAAQATFTLETDAAIDGATSQATLDALAATVDSYITAQGDVGLMFGADLSAYTPDQALAGLQYWLVTQGGQYFGALLAAGQADVVEFSRGRVTINSTVFFAQPAETWGVSITVPDRGVSVPLVIQSPTPGARPIRPNSAGVVLGTAPWTQQEADINEASIAGAVWTAPARTLNGALFT